MSCHLCRHHNKNVVLCHQLTLLKAQAVARVGDLKAALAVLETLSDAVNAAQPSSASSEASRLQATWQTASDHKDTGNELFRKGDLSGTCHKTESCLFALASFAGFQICSSVYSI